MSLDKKKKKKKEKKDGSSCETNDWETFESGFVQNKEFWIIIHLTLLIYINFKRIFSFCLAKLIGSVNSNNQLL